MGLMLTQMLGRDEAGNQILEQSNQRLPATIVLRID